MLTNTKTPRHVVTLADRIRVVRQRALVNDWYAEYARLLNESDSDESDPSPTPTPTRWTRSSRSAARARSVNGTSSGWPSWARPKTRDDQYVRPKRCKATRDEYEAHKHEMKSEHKHDYETQFATSTRTHGWMQRTRFHTTASRTCRAAPRRWTFIRTRGRTLPRRCGRRGVRRCAQRVGRRSARKSGSATPPMRPGARPADPSGDSSALERRELLRLREHVHRVTKRRVRVLLCPDGCWADALFRTAAMPAGQWLAWQHKSTAEMHTEKGQDLWQFRGRAWVHGRARRLLGQDRARSRVGCARQGAGRSRSSGHEVTKEKGTGRILPVPADGTTLPINLDGLVVALEASAPRWSRATRPRCARAPSRRPTRAWARRRPSSVRASWRGCGACTAASRCRGSRCRRRCATTTATCACCATAR